MSALHITAPPSYRLDMGRPLVAVVNGPGHSDGIFETTAEAVAAWRHA